MTATPLNQAHTDGIEHKYENNRYRARLLPQRYERRRGARENCIRRQADQLRRVRLEESWIVGGKAVIDSDILAFDPSELLQGMHKGRHIPLAARVILWPRHQPADTAHAFGLLGLS